VCRLPKVVKRRLKALKRIQADVNKVESKFYEEVHALEQKYAAQYEPFFQRVTFMIILVTYNLLTFLSSYFRLRTLYIIYSTACMECIVINCIGSLAVINSQHIWTSSCLKVSDLCLLVPIFLYITRAATFTQYH